MKEFLKKLIPSFILESYWDYKRRQIGSQLIRAWEQKGKPAPPPHAIKQKRIREYADRFNIKTLVETGTFKGEMVEAQRRRFEKIFSIELSHDLYLKAVQKFKNYKHIVLIEGDSSEKLKEVMTQVKGPCLFWLDGHYSGGITAKGTLNCPIFGELDTIFSTPSDHVLVIDDAIDFNGTEDYPTIGELENYVKGKRNNYKSDVRDNIICFFPG